MYLLIGYIAHLVVTLLANQQQSLRLTRMAHEILDQLPIFQHLLICRLVQRHGQVYIHAVTYSRS